MVFSRLALEVEGPGLPFSEIRSTNKTSLRLWIFLPEQDPISLHEKGNNFNCWYCNSECLFN